MNSFLSSALTTLSLSFLLGACLTSIILQLSLRLPGLSRSSLNRLHVAPTPVWGGVAIFLSFMVVASIRGLFNNRELIAMAISAGGIFLMGLVDDIWKLQPKWKLLGQVPCALIPLSFVFRHPLTGNGPIDIALALLWMVGITNAFNLLDNINGLSAGTAVLVSSFQAALFLNQAEPGRALASIAFGGAVMGFLIFNFPTGRIFMGDSGSLFIGFWLAATTLSSTHSSGMNQSGSILFPVLVMVVPICDTTLVTLTRVWRGRPVSVGGTDHLSHRLVAYGFSQKSAVLALWTFSFLSGILGIFAIFFGLSSLASVVILLLVSMVSLGTYLSRFELSTSSALRQEASWLSKFAPRARVASRVLLDVILMVAAYYTAYLLRFDGEISRADLHLLVSTTTELVLIKLCVLIAFRAYLPSWEYFGLRDAYRLVGISVLASLTAVTYFSTVYRFYGFSRILIAFDFLVFTFLTLIFRFSFRLLDELSPANHRTNVLIYGADSAGESALQYVSRHYRFRVVGFLDDARPNKDFSIHSVPIRGQAQDLGYLAKRWDAHIVLVTSSTTPEVKSKLSTLCSSLGIKLLSLQLTLVDLTTGDKSDGAQASFAKDLQAGDEQERIPKALRATSG